MSEIIICPILTIAKSNAEGGLAECEEIKCAWYDVCEKKCSIPSLTDRLAGIENRLSELNN